MTWNVRDAVSLPDSFGYTYAAAGAGTFQRCNERGPTAMTIFQKAGKSPAVGSPLDCGLTECQGKPQCVRCRRMADMDAICALLPEGVHLGAPLTPELLRELMPRQVQNEFGHLLTTDALWQMYTE